MFRTLRRTLDTCATLQVPEYTALILHEGLDQGLILREAMTFLSLHVTRYNFVALSGFRSR
jgi:hypothetical protein